MEVKACRPPTYYKIRDLGLPLLSVRQIDPN
jgi:hypothetical protein